MAWRKFFGWRIGLLIDEAHNIVERARQMHSAELGLAQIRAAMRLAPSAPRPGCGCNWMR